ncbi:beta-galactosidase [Luteolibacter sp. LG18]|nr:beta-galactosidase [Luteolibacter sp. LG18]
MKFPLSLLALVLAVTAPLHAQDMAGPGPRTKYNFNPGWMVNAGDAAGAESPSFADAGWKKVTLPYAWNEDSAFKVDIDQLPTGIAWYRKHFKVPADAAGKKIFLEFEGIRQKGQFFLNGELIGKNDNGVMAFGFDITDKVKPAPAENVLAARFDNAWGGRQWNDRNFYANYGGIPKNVFLHVTDKLHQTLPLYSNLGTTGTYIHAGNFDIAGRAATVTAESQVKNDHAEPTKFSYQVTVAGMDGKVVQTIQGGEQTLAAGETKLVTASGRVSNLNFWSWGYGYLYRVTTTLSVGGKPVDSVTTTTGFRKTEFGHGMLKLNDRAIQLKGYGQRTTNEWPAVGSAVPAWMSDFSNGLMVESGANLVRWMHVTPWKQDVESCDRVGLIQAMPAGDSEKDVGGQRWTERVEVMRDAIIYNRNNPSIVFYECGNAGISEEHMAEMKALRNQYDPYGGRAIGARDMHDSKEAEYGGHMLYINKSSTKPMWMMEYSRDEGLRKYWDDWTAPFHKDGDGPMHQNKPASDYNRNQDSHAVENVRRWFEYWQERPGTGERVNAGGVNIIFSDSNTHHRGAENYRRSGEVDAMRLPKDGFFAHQVMWDGWVEVEKPRIHLIGHWNYAPGVTKPVYVVSSADRVELFVNGQSLGFGEQSSRFLYTWKSVAFRPGSIKAVGYDKGGKKLCETAIQTAGAPAAIKLTPRTGPGGLKADGADLALVDVEVVDAQGNRCPTAMNLIQFDLQGPGEWRGGIAQSPDRPDNFILSRELPVECGINRVMLRSQPQAGEITLRANAAGLKPATIKIPSVAFPVLDGMAKTLPDAGLAAPLLRGPTPAGNSLAPARKAVHIAAATAGSNADQAGMAFDDSEKTNWKSDGKPGTGWIEFTMDHPAVISEITLKLGQFKKSYPLTITVDGKGVYSGETPPSLGYCTLKLEPALGKTVRITLAGAIKDGGAFDMTEITGKKLDDAGGKPVKGALEISEVEIYEPVKTGR